ncbi:Hsp70 family protein [Dactylosporangium sp. CA-233914]|uniref:Hsp70 family protein n=1 Tax=Dactylosporangium sp. CA-233914 TaxID=3239934 RepID=UPI003D8AEA73
MAASLLAVDYGTAYTVALRRHPGGIVEPVRIDGEEGLPSAVFVKHGDLITGREAVRCARIDPVMFHPAPKLDLGRDDRGEHPVRLAAATLRRIAGAAPADRAVLTTPATWPPARRRRLAEAAAAAGLPAAGLVPRPVAAATYCARLRPVAEGGAVLVHHLGAGGFEATALRLGEGAFEVLAAVAHPAGGRLLDEMTAHRFATALSPFEPGSGPPSARHRLGLLDNARDAREALSRQEYLEPLRPGAEGLTRAALEEVLRPVLAATVATGREALAQAGIGGEPVAWFLTGAASATPLLPRLVREQARVEPLVLRHPRHAVAAGALWSAAGDEPPRDGPDLLLLDTRRTYAAGGGHVTSSWHATSAPVEQLRQWYHHSLPGHAEAPAGRWSHERLDGGFRHFHHVSLFPAGDPAAAGLGPSWRVPDHLLTVIRDDTAILPA